MKKNVHFSSQSNEWATPRLLFERIESLTLGKRRFHLDPCCTAATKKCPYAFTMADDGLARDWSFYETVFVNPPYGREIGLWVRKAYEEWKKGATVILLIPSRTDTKWWHAYCMAAKRIIFIQGRVKFEQAGRENIVSAPFPSCVVVFDGKKIDNFPKISRMMA